MSSQQTDLRTVTIACPVCQRSSAQADARDLRQTLRIFYVIPFFFHRPTLVRCSCGAELISRLKAQELARGLASFAANPLSVRISPILKTLVLGGIVAWCLPLIGTVWMAFAYVWSRHYSGWIRTMALILLLLSLVPTCGLLLSGALSQPGK